MKLITLRYGPYTITKAAGEITFELSIAPFLDFHLVFNVELLRPHFLPLLDTSKVVEHFAPIKLNLDFIEQVIVDQIMDTQDEGINQHNIQLYRVVKVWQLLH
jgi:hypothetical protein